MDVQAAQLSMPFLGPVVCSYRKYNWQGLTEPIIPQNSSSILLSCHQLIPISFFLTCYSENLLSSYGGSSLEGWVWRGALVQPTCSCLCLVASDPGLRTQGSYLQHQCNLALATAFEIWIKFLLLPQVFLVNPAQWLPDLLSPQPSIALTILPTYLAINHIVLFSIVYCLIL